MRIVPPPDTVGRVTTTAGRLRGDIDLQPAGAGSIVASGVAGHETIALDGTGKIDARGVDARDGTVDNNGVGSIRYRGNPVQVPKVNGIGQISRQEGGMTATRTARAQIRLYVATSIDGFIADERGSVDWLEQFPSDNVLFERITSDIGTIVSGRATYDQGHDRGWPAGIPTIVVTSHPLPPAPNVSAYDGPLDVLVEQLRARPDDVWVIGGGRLMAAFLDANAVDRMAIFVVPIALGRGTPLFAGLQRIHALRFVSAGPHGDGGIIRLVYETASTA